MAKGYPSGDRNASGAMRRVSAMVAVSAIAFAAGCDRSTPAADTTVAPPAAASVPATQSAPAELPPAAAVAVEEAAPLAAMARLQGVDCRRSGGDIEHCTVEGYDISGSDRACAQDDSGFAAVGDIGGVALLDGFPAGGGTHASARIPKGQFVCVHYVADATDGSEGWAYVTAIPPALVAACAGKATCGDGRFSPQWVGTPPARACAVGPEGRYTTGCPAGWVMRSQLEEYSMGLGG
jgi:hypothetical protein